jgi:hypothetical protein
MGKEVGHFRYDRVEMEGRLPVRAEPSSSTKKGRRPPMCTHVTGAKVTTRREAGAIGIDFNADHIAVSHLDHSGNPLPALCESIPLVLAGKTSNQRREEIRLAAKAIAEIAGKAGKPIVPRKT